MNQTTHMWMESSVLMKRLLEGIEGTNKPDMEVVSAVSRVFEGRVKLINAHVFMFRIKSKNERALKAFNRMNLMDESTAIDLLLGDPEVDKVKCPYHDNLITRQECLDYSGTEGHVDGCRGCDYGTATKDMLIPRESR